MARSQRHRWRARAIPRHRANVAGTGPDRRGGPDNRIAEENAAGNETTRQSGGLHGGRAEVLRVGLRAGLSPGGAESPLSFPYTLNELPQPHVDFTCGLLNLNPEPSRVST